MIMTTNRHSPTPTNATLGTISTSCSSGVTVTSGSNNQYTISVSSNASLGSKTVTFNSNKGKSVIITFTVTASITHYWYSQISASVGSSYNANYLDNLLFPNMAFCSDGDADYDDDCGSLSLMKCSHTPFYTTSSYSPATNQLSKGHVNKWGCTLCCIAMVLRNKGATTTTQRYDYRVGSTGYLPADPFTCMMANIRGGTNNAWRTISSQNTITSCTSASSPTNVNWNDLSYDFGYKLTKVTLSGNDEQKAETIRQYLAVHPEGIVVRVKNNTHHIVITPTTFQAGDTTVSNNQFTIYDPGTSNPNIGNGVAWGSYSQSGYLSNATYFHFLEELP
ncbi:MAG: hypothetical protein PHV32_12295 [Eubacteriales bacterium]|nr:hypothetical protein [Eubacteriales bacterium]